MTEPEPKVDFTQIDFPSDELTVKVLRKAFPDGFDVDVAKDSLSLSDDRAYVRRTMDDGLGGFIDVERMVAERAFKVALGQSVTGDPNISNKHELIDILVHRYKQFGLARGEHEALTMLRRIETQAEAQARQYPGRSR
jgi:hypothetical protein